MGANSGNSDWGGAPRDPARIAAIVKMLGMLWQRPEHHDTRLGQLLVNIGAFPSSDPFYVEDDAVERALALAIARVDS